MNEDNRKTEGVGRAIIELEFVSRIRWDNQKKNVDGVGGRIEN